MKNGVIKENALGRGNDTIGCNGAVIWGKVEPAPRDRSGWGGGTQMKPQHKITVTELRRGGQDQPPKARVVPWPTSMRCLAPRSGVPSSSSEHEQQMVLS